MCALRPAKRTLIVGAGSGRDVASAALVREEFRLALGHVDLAGFLTPWALHSFSGRPEAPVNRPSQPARKFFVGAEGVPLKGFFEPFLEELAERHELRISQIYLFSLQHGISKLAAELAELVASNGYDRVLAVDVGGDVLADKEDYRTLLTPLVDFSCLDLLVRLPSAVQLLLAVMAPGAAGEMQSGRLREIMAELYSAEAVLGLWDYNMDCIPFKKYYNLNRDIEKITGSHSQTFDTIQRIAFSRKQRSFEETYRKTYQLGSSSWDISFKVEIPLEFQNKIILCDLRRLRALRSRPMLDYGSILESFKEISPLGFCGTEIDCSLVLAGSPGNHSQDSVLLLTPCRYAQGPTRKEIIHTGVDEVASGRVSDALILASDEGFLEGTADLEIQNEGRYLRHLRNKRTKH